MALATVLYAVFFITPELKAEVANSGANVVALAIPRVIVVFILTFGLVWSSRNFSASRHNFVVNRHRQNALSSFETFVKGASEPQTKDAVLLQATQSIFAPQDSGYIRNESLPVPGSQIVEVLRGAKGGSHAEG